MGDNLAPVPLDDTAATTDDAPTDVPLACADEDEGPLWDQTVDAAASAPPPALHAAHCHPVRAET